jgi:hypothetical protein
VAADVVSRPNCLLVSGLSAGRTFVNVLTPQLRPRADVDRYFHSWFHWLDATVITAAFVIDVLLKGVVEEVGSLVVVLRLWRVFKVIHKLSNLRIATSNSPFDLQIIEELSAGADEQMEPLRDRCHELEHENGELKREIAELKKPQHSNSS